jgi:hypothetical protein
MSVLIVVEVTASPSIVPLPGETTLRFSAKSFAPPPPPELAQVHYDLDPSHDVFFRDGGVLLKRVTRTAMIRGVSTPVEKIVRLEASPGPNSTEDSVEIIVEIIGTKGESDLSICTVILQ